MDKLLDKFNSLRVLVAGDIILDHYVFGSVDRISPEAPVPVLNIDRETWKLGGAANVASNVASLGGITTLIGFIGNDEAGSIVAKECGRKGVRLHSIEVSSTTTVKHRFIANKQQLLRVDKDQTLELAIDRTPLQTLIGGSDIIIVSDYNKGFVRAQGTMDTISECGKYVVVDPIPPNATYYENINLIKPNIEEASEMVSLLGLGVTNDKYSIASKLSSYYGCTAVITAGGEGIYTAKNPGSTHHYKTRPQEIYDVTGAGDTVTAALAMSIGVGISLEEACKIANVAGGIVVGQLGTVSVTIEELKRGM